MARAKQALFPARFANPLRRSADQPADLASLPSSRSDVSRNGASQAQHSIGVGASSPKNTQKSVKNTPSILAPKPARVSKHARKHASTALLDAVKESTSQPLRRAGAGSIYDADECKEHEDDDSLFLPMDELRQDSSESLGGIKDLAKMDIDHFQSVRGASNTNSQADLLPPIQQVVTSRSETSDGTTSIAQMTKRLTPHSTLSLRQPTAVGQLNVGPESRNVTTNNSGRLSIKSDPARRNPHSLPDLSAKLTSVITVFTRGPRNCESKIVTLHVAMLEDKSPFLTRLAESSPGPDLHLLELDCDAFSKFAAWLYGGGFEFDTFLSEDLGDILNSVLDCYTLALKLEATLFANAILEKACRVSAEKGLVFRNDVVNAIFARTNRGSKLRKWIVDEWVWQFDAEGLSEINWANDRVLEKEIIFEMFYSAAKRLGKGREVSRHYPFYLATDD
nr:hypothetical protein CFP56_03970 [Quercus suber]